MGTDGKVTDRGQTEDNGWGPLEGKQAQRLRASDQEETAVSFCRSSPLFASVSFSPPPSPFISVPLCVSLLLRLVPLSPLSPSVLLSLSLCLSLSPLWVGRQQGTPASAYIRAGLSAVLVAVWRMLSLILRVWQLGVSFTVSQVCVSPCAWRAGPIFCFRRCCLPPFVR